MLNIFKVILNRKLVYEENGFDVKESYSFEVKEENLLMLVLFMALMWRIFSLNKKSLPHPNNFIFCLFML